MLPNFFIVGAQKAATTSLHNYLYPHPEIYLPKQKETKFFVDDNRYKKGIAFYESEYFSAWKGEPAVGEADPDYIFFENALKRMAHDIKINSLKFIFLFRNPVERAFSHYLMSYRRGVEPLCFEEAVTKEPERIGENYLSRMRYSYVSRGFYMKQVERFLRYADKSQMLFLLTDDLNAGTEDCMKKIYGFLNVSTNFTSPSLKKKFHRAKNARFITLAQRISAETIEKKIVKKLLPWQGMRRKLRRKLNDFNLKNGKPKISLSGDMRVKLIKIFYQENKRLSDFIGRDLGRWNVMPD